MRVRWVCLFDTLHYSLKFQVDWEVEGSPDTVGKINHTLCSPFGHPFHIWHKTPVYHLGYHTGKSPSESQLSYYNAVGLHKTHSSKLGRDASWKQQMSCHRKRVQCHLCSADSCANSLLKGRKEGTRRKAFCWLFVHAVVKVGLFIWRAEQRAFDLQGRESHVGFDISASEKKWLLRVILRSSWKRPQLKPAPCLHLSVIRMLESWTSRLMARVCKPAVPPCGFKDNYSFEFIGRVCPVLLPRHDVFWLIKSILLV